MKAAALLAVVPLLASCDHVRNNQTSYANAAVGLGYSLAGAAVNRALTNECVASCSFGTQCNHETGVCEKTTETPPTRAVELTLDERCARAQSDWLAADRNGLGDQHPDKVMLRRVLAKCEELRNDPDPNAQRCGTRVLELTQLEGGGFGPSHPEVLAAKNEVDACYASNARVGQR